MAEPMQTRTRARVPLNLVVPANQNIMILPPLLGTLTLADIDEHALNTAYVHGDMVRFGTNFYWCVQAGNSAAVPGTEPDHDDGDAVDGGVIWRRMHWGRDVVTLVNLSANRRCSIARGEDAEVDHGITLYQGGTHNEGYGGPKPYDGAWYAISDPGGNTTLAISEG